MTEFCGDCEYLDRKNEYSDWFSGDRKYRCTIKNEYKKVSEEACNSIKNYKTSGSYQNSGCYITTLICNVLGYSDDHVVLRTLRNFRESYLKTKPEFIPMLQEYDQIGPMISRHLEDEINNQYTANLVLTYFIIPCVDAIQHQKYIEAVQYYEEMVEYFKQKYDLKNIQIDYNKEYDIETLGKGRILKMSTI